MRGLLTPGAVGGHGADDDLFFASAGEDVEGGVERHSLDFRVVGHDVVVPTSRATGPLRSAASSKASADVVQVVRSVEQVRGNIQRFKQRSAETDHRGAVLLGFELRIAAEQSNQQHNREVAIKRDSAQVVD